MCMTTSSRNDMDASCCEGMTRRHLLASAVASLALPGVVHAAPEDHNSPRLFFVSAGQTCAINADGTGFRAFHFDKPNQATWQPGGFLPGGGRMLVLSMEPRRDGPGRPFEKYYHQTPTHIWLYDMRDETLTEVATKERKAVFYTPQLVLSEDRILVQVVDDNGGSLYSMNLDGSGARPFTRPGEGLPYGLSLSPDGKRVAFHLASPDGYQIWTCNTEGGDRVRVAGHPDHLYFGPAWSPDGQWLVFVDCRYHDDPGHDWGDICVARPDGSEMRLLTEGQAHWFAATYGGPGNRGGGSNTPTWTRDGHILFTRRQLGTRVPWEYQAQRPDTDHFNRDWKPESAQGGTDICRVEPRTGAITVLAADDPAPWKCRAVESPDGSVIAYCRAATGEYPVLYTIRPDGAHPQLLTRGIDGQGADHPRWMP